MTASEVEIPALVPTSADGQDQHRVTDNSSDKGGVGTMWPGYGLENGHTPIPEEEARSAESGTATQSDTLNVFENINDENKSPGPRAAYLPSPAPSLSDHEGSIPPFPSLADGFLPYPQCLDHIDAGDAASLDGCESCAVSETDTSGLPPAIESSTDALNKTDDIHATPKRSSSSAKKTRGRSGTKSSDHSGVRRLSASKIHELTASPESLPIATVPDQPRTAEVTESHRPSMAAQLAASPQQGHDTIETRKKFKSAFPTAGTSEPRGCQ
ncbi:hypothetical protein VSDG_09542 [Cytospora chrysosperma]|uniref:Uncharacterized protein n=1 Tax=Cytospora chrysosperma TaxID=252740 RepID=A0A423VAK7_CYTCH|nr:hypothetical protein VSDG_09542 [Valsa sordida]